MRFGLVAAAAFLAASAASAAPVDPEVRKLITVGVGYDFDGETTVLTEPLARSNPESPDSRAQLPLPPECFRAPGITRVGPIEVATRRDAMINLQVIATFGMKVTLRCGAAEAEALPLIQVPSENSWTVFNNPKTAILNGLLLEGATNFVEYAKSNGGNLDEVRAGEIDGVEILSEPRITLAMLVSDQDGRYYKLYKAAYEGDALRDGVLTVLRELGCNVGETVDTGEGRKTFLLVGPPVDPATVFAEVRNMLADGMRLRTLTVNVQLEALAEAEARLQGRAFEGRPARELAEGADAICAA